ncbi:MAG: ROK family protein [Clostridiales bacterium]|nr:ROK family protein [Clostridiales bacterium]
MTDFKYYIGIDIGGTKCAVTSACSDGAQISFRDKKLFPTEDYPATIERILDAVECFSRKEKISSIGVSCGSPLDAEKGIILSPPNLPGWDEVRIKDMLEDRFGTGAYLENDANACALAEYRFGAGRESRNMIFLTFGTGFGAGLILDGRLYRGTNGYAGEIGHVRLEESGPVGYGKEGSCEGFCSGGGLARISSEKVKHAIREGKSVSFCNSVAEADSLNAKTVAEAARRGDELALDIYRECGRNLGRSVSILLDIINPDTVVIGSIFERSEDLLRAEMEKAISEEALEYTRKICKIKKAELGDLIGDYAAVSIAIEGEKYDNHR